MPTASPNHDKFRASTNRDVSSFSFSPLSSLFIAIMVVVPVVAGVGIFAMYRSGIVLFSSGDSSENSVNELAKVEIQSEIVDLRTLESATFGELPVVLAVAPTNPTEYSDTVIGCITSDLHSSGRTTVTVFTERFYVDGGFETVWLGDTKILSTVRREQPKLREYLLVRFTTEETTQSEFDGFLTTRGTLSVRHYRSETLAHSLTVNGAGLGASKRSSTIECSERLAELAVEQMAQQEWWK